MEDASTSGNTNISPQLLNEWIEIQDSLKKRLTIEDEFDWKLPPMKDQDSEGIEENQDSSGEILKYVGGVDLSFSRNDSLIACATLVVLDISTLEVVHEDSSIIKLRTSASRTSKENEEDITYTVSPGFGLACHLGVLADLPTIGIGKNAMRTTKGSLKPILFQLVIVYLFRVLSRLSSCLVGFGFQNHQAGVS
ncbi:UNVERIFIED_CONTAM: Endonuclease V [Sesamum angustifolium]|uniref:Endonuclease V n=1 Tax=Sesamum angustifolium TaxID=2727405 RepID=A0AAW2MHZ9_9LAMI